MKKIVIIDDEEHFCILIKKNLERTGEYEVSTATDGETGIKLVKDIRPDLVLLDVIMPGMDGGDVVAEIRRDQSIQDTPVVFLTAIVREAEDSPQASFTKGYAILAKTVTVEELLACIKRNMRVGGA